MSGDEHLIMCTVQIREALPPYIPSWCLTVLGRAALRLELCVGAHQPAERACRRPVESFCTSRLAP